MEGNNDNFMQRIGIGKVAVCAQKFLKCVVPENIHTSTPWKIATSSEGEGHLHSQNFRQEWTFSPQ